MIPFFRKIRKKLADNNQFFKYSRYAIGEIVLVVIGILIALQINNWNEDRKNKLQENKILYNLKDEFQENLAEEMLADSNKAGLFIAQLTDKSDEERKDFLGVDKISDELTSKLDAINDLDNLYNDKDLIADIVQDIKNKIFIKVWKQMFIFSSLCI